MTILDIKSKLKADYKYKIETHAHTNPASPCSMASSEEVVRLYKEAGFDAVCITNHFILNLFEGQSIYKNLTKEEKIDRWLKDFDEAKKYGEKYGIKVILGAELRFIENLNDYLIYGINRDDLLRIYDFLGGTLENFRKNLKLPNSVFIQAHPFRDPCKPADASLLDGVETFNCHISHNPKTTEAVRYAKENNIAIALCGSDFHGHPECKAGASALLTQKLPRDTFELAEIIKSLDYIFNLGTNSIVIP